MNRLKAFFATRRARWGLVAALTLLTALIHIAHPRQPHPSWGDTPQYLAGAYHLFNHGVYSQSHDPGPVTPEIGREPGYAALLVGLMAADPAFARFTPACMVADDACPPRMFRVVQGVNAVLIALSGAVLVATALTLGLGWGPALLAGLYLWANGEMAKGWHFIASDPLAVFLATLATWTAAWAWGRGGAARWALAGLALAALALVKAVFMYFAILATLGAGLAITIWGGAARARALATLVAFTVVFAAPLGLWMARNASVDGVFKLTDSRGGIALSTREVFNHMTPSQYAASFVFWTRGFGDGLARKLFPADVVEPFDFGHPGGFYDRGQNGYDPRVRAKMAETGLSEADATKAVDKELMTAILERPLTHIATTLPLLYRGIWVDEFAIIGVPIFVFALWRVALRRDWAWLIVLTPGLFNHVFYAALSLNVSRYQMTAIPALALACALAFQWWLNRRARLEERQA